MADSSPAGAGLPRPMSIGEILDRAISTYVRRCLPLFVILAITVIPVTLLQLAATPGFAHVSELFAEMNRLPIADQVDRGRLMNQALGSLNGGSIFALFILWPLILFPLTRNAIYTYAEAALENATVSIAAVYRASIARWVAQIVVVIGYFTIALGITLVGSTFITLIGGLVYFAAGRGSAAGGIVVVLIVLFFITLFLSFALLNVAFELSSVSVALEDKNPFRAMGNGWRRTFDRALRRRTIGIALAFSAVELLGSVAMIAVSGLLQALTHLALLQALVAAIGQIVISGILGVFMVAYARDVRLRREGYDLLRAASEPAPAT
jgi:hypothetical protein